ncbi:hypothetical protein Hanom_Chr06g00509431 [Helianthus anomalus]
MESIGLYILMASTLCIAAIILELTFNTVMMKKFWVPVKLFSLNAASLTVIAVAMKLPMDLTTPMPSEVNQVAKVGRLGFLCVMMYISMPSLASLDNKSLFANIQTQVIRRECVHPFIMSPFMAACIYMGMLLLLLVIFISSTVTIPTLKNLVELKYQATLNDQNLQENRILKVEELRQLLKRHCIMATTNSPQLLVNDTDEDFSNHVLLPEDDVLFTKQPHNLLKLLEKSIGFEGVETFDTDQTQSLLPVELVNTWSLPILSLTCIAIVIPNIDKDVVDNLLKSVDEGISFTTIVEKSLNKASKYVNIQRATTNLWCEVIKNHKWLDTTLRRSAYQGKALTYIIKSFAHTSKDIVNEFNRSTN